MQMIYVLLIMSLNLAGGQTMGEFNTKEACEEAKSFVLAETDKRFTTRGMFIVECLKKG